jgi:dTMP kinase
MKGRLVVVEGIDGSGKRTQCNFLEKSLKEIGYRSKIYGFPDYAASAVGPVIRRMLSGEFGDSSRFDPRMIAPLFALDRFEKRDEIIKNLSAGYIVICDRYVYSNVAHQLSRVSESEREDLKEWIENLEFNILGLPKADLTVL